MISHQGIFLIRNEIIFISRILFRGCLVVIIYSFKEAAVSGNKQIAADPVLIRSVIISVNDRGNSIFIIFKMFSLKSLCNGKASGFRTHPVKVGHTGFYRFRIRGLRAECNQTALGIGRGILLSIPDIFKRRDCHNIRFRIILSQRLQCISVSGINVGTYMILKGCHAAVYNITDVVIRRKRIIFGMKQAIVIHLVSEAIEVLHSFIHIIPRKLTGNQGLYGI